MARPGLRLELRAALQRAITTAQPAMRPRVIIGTNGGQQEIDLYVQPLRFEPGYMIVFQDLGAIRAIADPGAVLF